MLFKGGDGDWIFNDWLFIWGASMNSLQNLERRCLARVGVIRPGPHCPHTALGPSCFFTKKLKFLFNISSHLGAQ